jgi:release factor glutamine methyltransferase
MTINSAYQYLKNILVNIYDVKESGNIAELIIEKISGLKRTERILNKQKPLNIQQINIIGNYLQELINHKPVQYVLNEAWFTGIKFFVDGNVLIPRPETEELVEWIVQDAHTNSRMTIDDSRFTILDIGTGSGCIAIALKKKVNNADVFALDISEAALNVAALNAQQNNTDINFFKADILQNQINITMPLFDIIVSNPPYITKKESAEMHSNVVAYEPYLALFVPDENPLIFYNAISDFALSHLKENGNLYFEIHENFANEIVNLLQEKKFQSIEIKKDLQQKNRMVKAVLNK